MSDIANIFKPAQINLLSLIFAFIIVVYSADEECFIWWDRSHYHMNKGNVHNLKDKAMISERDFSTWLGDY